VILFPAGLIGPILGWSSWGLIAGEALAALMLKRINPYSIHVTMARSNSQVAQSKQ